MTQRTYNIFILLMLVILGVTQFYMQPRIGIFDPSLVVKAYAQSIAINKYNAPTSVAKTAGDLKLMITNYAKGHRVLLFSKGTVWSDGLFNHTENILQMLEEKQ